MRSQFPPLCGCYQCHGNAPCTEIYSLAFIRSILFVPTRNTTCRSHTNTRTNSHTHHDANQIGDKLLEPTSRSDQLVTWAPRLKRKIKPTATITRRREKEQFKSLCAAGKFKICPRHKQVSHVRWILMESHEAALGWWRRQAAGHLQALEEQ